jgi:hypothetical protein
MTARARHIAALFLSVALAAALAVATADPIRAAVMAQRGAFGWSIARAEWAGDLLALAVAGVLLLATPVAVALWGMRRGGAAR